MTDHDYGFETLCLHAGQAPDAATGARAGPIYQTAAYVFDDTDHAASLFNLQTFGNIYTRLMNPTTAMFEERMAALEGGRAAVATSTGMAAQMAALLTLLKQGDEIVSANTLYGGTVTQFAVTFKRMGINAVLVDPDDPDNFARAITGKTRAVYGETIGNPNNNVLDIEALAAIAHDAGVPLVIDNTFASPYLCRPMEFGADLVVHSATKFICGHGTSMGGVVVESGRFPWDNGRHPDMVEPSEGYHGVRFYETFGDFAFTMKARCETMRTLGPALSPFNAWIMLKGLETMALRVNAQAETAQKLAEALEGHPALERTLYPGLKTHAQSALVQSQLGGKGGTVLSLDIKGGKAAAFAFLNAMSIPVISNNLGDAKSIATHPATTTHQRLSEEQRDELGITPGLIRFSVGLEDAGDLLADIQNALEISQK